MKVIVLAAGQGTRLRPLTNEKPKCMVEYKGKAIISHLLETFKSSGVGSINIVGGYKIDVLKDYLKDEEVSFFENKKFDKTNMVSTLFCAEEILEEEDIIISYADIIYRDDVLNKLIASKDEFSVVVDRKWEDLWKLRMENPLDDVETLKIRDNCIVELGKKPSSMSEVEGQYIGLIKISKSAVKKFVEYYHSLNRGEKYDGKNFDNMYMTSFIQLIIDNLSDVKPVLIDGGWLEVDSVDDLKAYTKADIL